jgi:hypothetical protein
MACSPFELSWRVLWLPKNGYSVEEYEDAWAAESSGRLAVADGASESAFAALWARLLTEEFVAASPSSDSSDWLNRSRRRWLADVMTLDLAWYGEMKREEGAFATFLGISLRPPNDENPGTWLAVAVGDSCLMQVRQGRLLFAFPLKFSTDFANVPRLIGSRDPSVPHLEEATGSLVNGDRFFLMTDALAKWFLQTHERGGCPWNVVAEVLSAEEPESAFAEWIEELRERRELQNDDVTLIAVEVKSGHQESGTELKE